MYVCVCARAFTRMVGGRCCGAGGELGEKQIVKAVERMKLVTPGGVDFIYQVKTKECLGIYMVLLFLWRSKGGLWQFLFLEQEDKHHTVKMTATHGSVLR